MCGACPTGYRGDGVTCVYVGSCAINNGGCHPLATCVENSALTSAYVICRCPPGTVGDGIGPNGCQSSTEVSPCSSNPCVHGKCATVSGNTYACTCDAGYTGECLSISIIFDQRCEYLRLLSIRDNVQRENRPVLPESLQKQRCLHDFERCGELRLPVDIHRHQMRNAATDVRRCFA